jgi:cytochrome bd-type quinol oxidase subunit 1
MISLLRLPTAPLLQEKRSVAYAIVFGIWAEVFLYCVLHDQYLVRLAPAHFTEYHAPLWGIENLSLLAAGWAFRASVGPGLVLGLAALFLGRAGNRPKIEPHTMLKIVPCLILLTEACGLLAGWWAWKNERPLYPEIVYPDLTRPILTSQSIQLTCYAAGAISSGIFLGWIVWHRRRVAHDSEK